MSVSLTSPGGAVTYADSQDHFENGLLRLMNLEASEFGHWLELAEEQNGDLLTRLGLGWQALRPAPDDGAPAHGQLGPGPSGRDGRLWHAAIAESPSHGVAISDADEHAWLVRWDGRRFVFEHRPPVYEEEYFEGDKLKAGGYGDYTAQSGWRLEKAARQVREMHAITGIRHGRVLDIGSGYGFFRVALSNAGYDEEGLEVSDFARAVAQSSYGLDTYPGTLDDHWQDWTESYDVATMFDLIEHLADPDSLLAKTAAILRPDGFVAIKTPNIQCPEAEVFGPWYHSLKREHLGFFSPGSLTAMADRHGFEPVQVATVSHLLRGFVGPDETAAWERDLRGADIVAWYRKTGS
jgi:2-polyprenyl-3-methyl-5-hydroxy-6-metoxy-1,4-benzoquinol methylase